MKLGKIQKAWIADLRKYPERQFKNKLGEKNEKGEIKACCLGQALLTYCEVEGIKPVWEYEKSNDSYVLSDFLHSEMYLVGSYNKLGLRDGAGDLLNSVVIGNCIYSSLASMNDNDIPWSKIADYIESNPENVFQESK